MTTQSGERSVNDHYGCGDLGRRILEGLRIAGKDPDALTVDDLAPLDQLHVHGKKATVELARLARLTPGMNVLDVGGGLGGPARILATEFGCALTVLDLTEEFCLVGEMLTVRTKLSDCVTFRCGDALAMPFSDNSFDAVWMQHSSMNIAAKERLFAEIHRVLRSGGRLALHEIMAGPVTPLHFPVPWARNSTLNHLLSPETLRALIKQSGFTEMAWIDITKFVVTGVNERLASMQPTPEVRSSLGLHLIFGPDLAQMVQNQIRNVKENRTVVIQAVFGRL